MQIEVDTIIDSRYKVVGVIGSGGFGAVFKARHISLERLAAVKLLKTDLLVNSETESRFRREAQAVAALQHRNLPVFFGYGIWNNCAYIAMEYLDGIGLDQMLRDSNGLSVDTTFKIIKQVCDALACAHSNGIVHRDIKPSNIVIVSTPDEPKLVKLIDFGLAKIIENKGRFSLSLTETGYAIGTAAYMSPEQCLAEATDSRSDIYSVGCVLQNCLTGRTPYEEGPSMVMMNNHVSACPHSLAHARPDLDFPEGLQAVLNKCMAKDLSDRYQNISELKDDLELLEKEVPKSISASNAKVASVKHKSWKNSSLLKPMTGLLCLALSLSAIGATYYAMLRRDASSNLEQNQLRRTSADLYQRLNHEIDRDNAPFTEEQKLYYWRQVLEKNEVDHLLNSFQQSRARLRIAHILLQKNDYNGALIAAQQSLNARSNISNIRNTGTIDALCILTSAAYRAGKPHAGLKYARTFRRMEFDGCSAQLCEQGWSAVVLNMIQCGKLDEAISSAKLIAWKPDTQAAKTAIQLIKAEEALRAQKYSQSLKHLRAVKSPDSATDRVLTDLCICLMATGAWEQALEPFSKLQKRLPPDRGCYLLLQALFKAHENKWDDVENFESAALAASQQNSDLYNLAAYNYEMPLLINVCRVAGQKQLANSLESDLAKMIKSAS